VAYLYKLIFFFFFIILFNHAECKNITPLILNILVQLVMIY